MQSELVSPEVLPACSRKTLVFGTAKVTVPKDLVTYMVVIYNYLEFEEVTIR